MPRPARVFHVDENVAGLSLVEALRRLVPEESLAVTRDWVTARRVQIHGNLCTAPDRRVTRGDVVHLWSHPLAPVPGAEDVRILHLDPHLVVVDKPAGLTTRAEPGSDGRRRREPTLDALVARAVAARAATAKAGARARERGGRIRPVHRLDRETSGVLVLARTGYTEERLLRLFATHAMERSYLAVVEGSFERSRRIETWLVRDRGDGLRGSHPAGRSAPGGKRAVTHVRPLERLGDYTLVECRLETGRTHQIRIHLSEIGHRVCGERLYDHAPGERPQPDPSGAPRLALHAAELAFRHPVTGRDLHFRVPPPAHLADWIARLRNG